ncbi:hypothetical protein FNF27_07646 [Cafeteria roenbergensis]|uniref:ATP-grasp domain-containing protein n=1 Tax=Cafeteria roenbergensis TaxID=33653 RepID=A0A5A8DIU7_CAFRO|nr:hypothetical protein FNF27_07646 [Cafeteria roenbergensis]
MAAPAPCFDVIRGGNNSRPFLRAMRLRARWARETGTAPAWFKLVNSGGKGEREETALPFPASTRSECYCANFVWKATSRKAKQAPPSFRRWHKSVLLRQVFAHLPAVTPLTAKDRLLRVLRTYAAATGRGLDALGVPDTFLVEPRGGAPPAHWRGWSDFEASHRRHAGREGCRNLWLVKPANANRGNGIEVVDTLADARACLEGVASRASMGVQGTWVVQKYIENPLLLAGRKFDLRVWVLVTDDGDVFVHGPGYVRTSSEAFTMDNTDRRVHLTNYCLQVKHRGEGSSFERFEAGNTLSWAQLAVYLGQVAAGQRAHAVPAEAPADPAADPEGASHPDAWPEGPPCLARGPAACAAPHAATQASSASSPSSSSSSPPPSAASAASASAASPLKQWPPVGDSLAWATGCHAFWGADGLWDRVTALVRETIRALRVDRPSAASKDGCREFGFGDRPNSSPRHRFELLGYDFMVTTALPATSVAPLEPPADPATASPAELASRLGLGVRLIEVNSNPSLSYQCPWHRALVDRMVHRALGLTVDVVFGAPARPPPASKGATEDAEVLAEPLSSDDEDERSDAEERAEAAAAEAAAKGAAAEAAAAKGAAAEAAAAKGAAAEALKGGGAGSAPALERAR